MLLENRRIHGLPQIGKEYDWECPDVGLFRVKVVGYAPRTSDREYAQSLAQFCRVSFDHGQAWAPVSDLREIAR